LRWDDLQKGAPFLLSTPYYHSEHLGWLGNRSSAIASSRAFWNLAGDLSRANIISQSQQKIYDNFVHKFTNGAYPMMPAILQDPFAVETNELQEPVGFSFEDPDLEREPATTLGLDFFGPEKVQQHVLPSTVLAHTGEIKKGKKRFSYARMPDEAPESVTTKKPRQEMSQDTAPAMIDKRQEMSQDTPPAVIDKRQKMSQDTPPAMIETRQEMSRDTPPAMIEKIKQITKESFIEAAARQAREQVLQSMTKGITPVVPQTPPGWFVCTLVAGCRQSFSTRSGLLDHQRVYHKDEYKPPARTSGQYVCDIVDGCRNSYPKPRGLRDHQLRAHREEYKKLQEALKSIGKEGRERGN
jgi:hypothetical protein